VSLESGGLLVIVCSSQSHSENDQRNWLRAILFDDLVRARKHVGRNRLTILDFRFLSHRITLSALAKTLGGMVNPICLAVFKLITNSNFVGCSTGRPAGWRLSESCPRICNAGLSADVHRINT
jgi:hypothetical protein